MIKLIKYYPFILNLYILITMSLYIIGISYQLSNYVYTFIGQSFITNILLLHFSYKFKFCFWHRLLIYNMSFCLFLETLINYGILINNYIYIVVILTIITIFIALILLKRHGTFNKKKIN